MFAILTTAVLAACGKEKTEDDGKDFVYVPEFVSLEGDYGFSDFMYGGGFLYYTAYTEDEGDALYQYDPAEKTLRKLSLPEGKEGASRTRTVMDEKGNLYIIYVNWQYNEANPENSYMENYLAKYDAGMNQVFLNDITDRLRSGDDEGYIQSMALDQEGHVYISTQSTVHLLDGDGNYAGAVDLSAAWIESLGTGKDGRVYAVYYDRSSGGSVAAAIDYAGKTVDKKLDGLPEENGNLILSAGSDKDFLISNSGKLYEYDMATQSSEEVLEWLASDINGNYVRFICATEDGRILAVTQDWETNTTECISLTKTAASEVQAKEEIVVGVLYGDQALQSAAVTFNKNSDKYHISIRQYYGGDDSIEYEDAIAKLNSDIASKDNCPDILEVDSLDIQHLNALGAFEDLKLWLDKSSVLSEESFMERVLNAYTYDGRLVCIPKSFQINTIVGKKSELGDAKGWTIKEIMAFAESHPDAELFQYATRSEMMEIFMAFNQDAFIDWEKGTCNFDGEEFQRILEFVGSFPEDYDWVDDGMNIHDRLASGRLLLYSAYISELQDIQLYEALFGEEVTYIGYPTLSGSGGSVFTGTGCYAIASGSRHKDGAWSFIEGYLSGNNDMYNWGLPSNREKFDALVEKELHVEYVKDENGELLLDENGNPIPEGGSGGLYMDGFEYTYRPSTREEIDTLLALIDRSAPISLGDREIMKLISEEAEAFYKGDKSAAEAAELIQKRVSIYVSENK